MSLSTLTVISVRRSQDFAVGLRPRVCWAAAYDRPGIWGAMSLTRPHGESMAGDGWCLGLVLSSKTDRSVPSFGERAEREGRGGRERRRREMDVGSGQVGDDRE